MRLFTSGRIAKVISERNLSLVNYLRTDKAQVLGGFKRQASVNCTRDRILIARLADFGCVRASSEVWESLYLLWLF